MAPEDKNRKRPIYKLDVPEFPCLYCGVCCAKFQPQLSLPEAQSLADNLGISRERFLADYTDPRWPGTRSFLLRHTGGACIFLRTSEDRRKKLCRIQAFKPQCCREWREGKDKSECREGLKSGWGLTVDSAGQICGEREKVEAFERFIRAQNSPSA